MSLLEILEYPDPRLRTIAKPVKDVTPQITILIDDMFEIIVDGMLEKVEMQPFAQKVVRQVSSVVHKAVNVLISKVVGKLSNKELKPLVSQFKSMEFEHEGTIFLGFEVEARMEAMIHSCIAHLEAGDLPNAKSELIELLEHLIDESLDLYLMVPMSLVRLGMISRKLVDLTQTTIEKAVPPALRKIVDHMDQQEMETLREFLLELIILE